MLRHGCSVRQSYLDFDMIVFPPNIPFPYRFVRLFALAVATPMITSLGQLPTSFDSYPNVLLIYADDLGYGDVGCYNPESKVPTPHMDHLATEGIRFEDAHSPSTVCTPSRYGVMTVSYTHLTLPTKRIV